MSYPQVKEIFLDLWNNNFPRLQDIAAQIAQDNVEKYVSAFFEVLLANRERIDIGKIADPDVQFLFNKIMVSSARRGDKINPELLSELLVERLSNDSSEMIDLLCAEAIEVIPKLTKEQIAFITLCHFMSRVTFSGIHHAFRLEPYGSLVLPLVMPCDNISETSKEFLAYIGVLDISTILGSDIYEGLARVYPFLNGQVKEQLQVFAPSYNAITELYEKCQAYQIHLTAVGKMIALVNLKRVLPQIDYKIWLN